MIPSCTTGIIKRFIALATACMLSSCAAFLRDGKPVEFTAATYNVHYMERGIPGLVRTIKGLDADGGWLPTNSDTFPLPDDTRKKIGERVPIWLVPRSITLDYIFVSDGVKVLETDVIKSDASDHWPLVGRFRL